MTARKTWITGLIILIVGIIGYVQISKMKKAPQKKENRSQVIAPYFVVKNGTESLIIEGTGQVKSKDRIDIFSEVNGILQKTKKDFRPGVQFKKGEMMIKIDDSEYKASLYSKRSDFENLITSLLPDIKLEFPDEFNKWYNYLISLNIDSPLKPLPNVKSQKEKFFITGKKVYSTFYTIRNMETRFDKYNIRAPFNGVITESNVNPGTLIRSGQKIGIFSNTDVFEIKISVKAVDANLINTGDIAKIFSTDDNKYHSGKVARINPAIDLNTQTVSIFIESDDKSLREGMFVEAKINAGEISNVFELPRSILTENQWIYIINDDSTLKRERINAVRYLTNSVIVDNLPDNTKVLSRNIPGIFPDLKVIPKHVED
jgi:multidrug efflux pump subunit AcrA (membrane-fusion protein)